MQTSIVFTPYLTHKKQQERDLGWTKVPHWPPLLPDGCQLSPKPAKSRQEKLLDPAKTHTTNYQLKSA